jgi:hypothetical protein
MYCIIYWTQSRKRRSKTQLIPMNRRTWILMCECVRNLDLWWWSIFFWIDDHQSSIMMVTKSVTITNNSRHNFVWVIMSLFCWQYLLRMNLTVRMTDGWRTCAQRIQIIIRWKTKPMKSWIYRIDMHLARKPPKAQSLRMNHRVPTFLLFNQIKQTLSSNHLYLHIYHS